MTETDWSRSPLGPPEAWPPSLNTVVSLMLGSKFPMFAAWGPELALVYNDAYAEILGVKHPAALGARFEDVWSEIWEEITPLVRTALSGEAIYLEDLPLVLRRSGQDEQTYFTFSYSPIRQEDGAVGGMFCAVAETTSKILVEQRLRQSRVALAESERRFRNMADHAPVMMWVTEEDGTCTYLNRKWFDYTGQTEAEALGFGWLDATHPDDKAKAEEVFRAANAAREDFRVEYRLRDAAGSYRWFLDAAAPRFDEEGRYLGYIGSVIDIQERREAEEQTREGERRLRVMMNAMPAFVWLAKPDGELTYFNDRWYEYTGQHPADALPDGWTDALHPDDVERTARDWAHARAQLSPYQIEIRYRRRDGEHRWYLAKAEPIRDHAGAVTAWLGVSLDIHDSKTAAEHQGLLINELNHRVKNTLATVQSMAAQTVRGSENPQAAHEVFMARLLALSAAHNVLTEERWTGADLADVVQNAARPFSESAQDRFRASGPSVRLSPKVSLAISMALHELGTNASKYGALSVAEGWVALDWRLDDASRLRLTWSEHGGPPVTPPSRRGFGSRLLERGLASELGGTVRLDFRPEGLICEIDADLTASSDE